MSIATEHLPNVKIIDRPQKPISSRKFPLYKGGQRDFVNGDGGGYYQVISKQVETPLGLAFLELPFHVLNHQDRANALTPFEVGQGTSVGRALNGTSPEGKIDSTVAPILLLAKLSYHLHQPSVSLAQQSILVEFPEFEFIDPNGELQRVPTSTYISLPTKAYLLRGQTVYQFFNSVDAPDLPIGPTGEGLYVRIPSDPQQYEQIQAHFR